MQHICTVVRGAGHRTVHAHVSHRERQTGRCSLDPLLPAAPVGIGSNIMEYTYGTYCSTYTHTQPAHVVFCDPDPRRLKSTTSRWTFV
jgi:hypothetical protein